MAPALTPASATFVVNTTNDTGLASGDSTSCADSDGNCSLRAAVEAADNLGNQATPQAVTITVPAGTYTLTSAQGGEIYVENPAGVTVNGAELEQRRLLLTVRTGLLASERSRAPPCLERDHRERWRYQPRQRHIGNTASPYPSPRI